MKKYRDIMSCYKYWGKIEEIADKLSNFGNLDDDMDALDDVAIDEVIEILDEVEVISSILPQYL